MGAREVLVAIVCLVQPIQVEGIGGFGPLADVVQADCWDNVVRFAVTNFVCGVQG